MGWIQKRRNRSSGDDLPRRRPNGGSSPVFSYYARGSVASGGQNTGRREGNDATSKRSIAGHRLRIGHLPTYVALIALVVAGLYAGYIQPEPKIIIINSKGTVHRDANEYKTAIHNIWKESLLNQTKLTINTYDLGKTIKNQFNELGNVQIELPLLGRRPVVLLTPDRPALQIVSSNGMFYVNGDGKVMARTGDVVQNRLGDLPVVRDETGLHAEVGKSILSGQETDYLNKLFAYLRQEGVIIQSITLPSSAARQADVRLAGQGYYIKFSFDSDPRQAVGTYLLAIQKIKAEGVEPAEYIDVRVGEKVFYK